MAKVLVVEGSSLGFHPKLFQKTTEAFTKKRNDVSVCVGSGFDGWSYALAAGFDHVHFTRVPDEDSAAKILEMLPPGLSFSFTLLGFTKRTTGKPMWELARRAKRVYVFSINPQDTKEHILKQKGWARLDNVRVADELPYETVKFYRKESKWQTRDRLNIPQEWRMGLYFGAYWYSKGADLLMAETQTAPFDPYVRIFFVGDSSLSSLGEGPFPHDGKICRFIDRYVTEEEARDFFRAADFVIMPYRKFYEWDTSGVWNQAMLAETPVLVPYFQPFSGLLERFRVGRYIPLNQSLRWAINDIAGLTHVNTWEFDKYLHAQKIGWDIIGEGI